MHSGYAINFKMSTLQTWRFIPYDIRQITTLSALECSEPIRTPCPHHVYSRAYVRTYGTPGNPSRKVVLRKGKRNDTGLSYLT